MHETCQCYFSTCGQLLTEFPGLAFGSRFCRDGCRAINLHLEVILVRYVQTAGFIHRDPADQAELARQILYSRSAEPHKQLPCRIEDLYIVERGVGNIDVAVAVHC